MIAFVKVHFGKQQVWKLITLEKFNSGNDCLCKSALWETISLERSWPLSATVDMHTYTGVFIRWNGMVE